MEKAKRVLGLRHVIGETQLVLETHIYGVERRWRHPKRRCLYYYSATREG